MLIPVVAHSPRIVARAGGYRVHGTVRDATNEAKTKFLHELVPDAKYPLELFSADLQVEGSFDEAVKGCKYAIHCAASVMLSAPGE